MSSAIVYSYFRSHNPPSSAFTPIYIPFLNVPAEDIDLRPEFKLVFKEAGIKALDLVTLSDLLSTEKLKDELPPENTRWILVDHNKLEGKLGEVYGDRVHGVIDHHEEENAVPKDTSPEPRVVETCGSCTSLIVKHFASEWEKMDIAPYEDAHLAKLALGSILIDTKNLKNEFKVRKPDVEASNNCINRIVAVEKAWEQKEFYKRLKKAKRNIEHLPLHGILRKDYKQWTEGNMSLGVSSVVKPLQFLSSKAQNEAEAAKDPHSKAWSAATHDFMSERELDMYAVMTNSTGVSGSTRELCIEWKGDEAAEAVKHFENISGATLGLEKRNIDGINEDSRRLWRQRSVDLSRKQVAPMIRKAMRGDSGL
ncbi:MAG: Exopolyphosphatase [Stictis urceolatum]|nr:Exopolyphosphatase [Stictis urceolata]